MTDASSLRRTRSLHVVPHTHWDREWYRPFEAYRYRLVQTLDRVLGCDLPYFLLDGQTAVIDDYLALRPEQAVVLRERIREGRLGVGPWFVLVDEFLVSGEALVRNLQEGRRAMTSLGAGEAVGYLPDMFGHGAQMPQILLGFGLDQAVLWRGVKPPSPRFRWRGPDGSAVNAAWLPQGYYQTMFMEELTLEQRRAQLDTYLEGFGNEPVAWLLAGADHMAPRTDLAALIGDVQEQLPDTLLTVTSLRDALRGPAPTAEVAGELRQPHGMAYVLPGVLSARVPLKQANAACQSLLERYVEPLTALAWRQGQAYPEAFVRHAWRTLMLNHPHDSICGCSIDQVHREMWPRFAAVEQVGEELLAAAVGKLARPRANPPVFAFNPTGWAWSGWVELEVEWPLADAPAAITLEGAGEVVSLGVEDGESFRAEIDFNPDWFPVRRFKLAARLDLPPLGGARLKAVPGAPAARDGVRAGEDWLENENLMVRVVDGLVELRDKRTGQVFADVHGFADDGDAGDEYNFSPPADEAPRRAHLRGCKLVSARPHAASLELTYVLVIPAGLAPDRSRRGDDEVTLTLTSRLTLRAGGERVEVETRYENLARDHRLRLLVGWQDPVRPAIWAEGTFGVFERPPVAQPELPVARRTEAVMPEFPTAGFTVLAGKAGSLAVAAPGLYEASWMHHGALALTLLRAVGWLSRDDLRTRGGGAGPRFETPEAQCLGEQVVRYALIPGSPDWHSTLRAAQQFNAAPRAWVAEGLDAPGIDLGHPLVVASALTRSEDGESLILRAFNPTDRPLMARPAAGLTPVRLDETPLQDGGPADYGAYQIRTWRLR